MGVEARLKLGKVMVFIKSIIIARSYFFRHGCSKRVGGGARRRAEVRALEEMQR